MGAKLLRGDERRWPRSNAADALITTAIMWQAAKIFVEKSEQRSKLKAQMNVENWTYLCNRLDTYVRTGKPTGTILRGRKPWSGRKRSWQVV